MAKWQSGDTVMIAAREVTAVDAKSGLYYAHYAGLTGKILKVYNEEASVLVERSSLPETIRKRHEENEKAMKSRWLDNLSDEARNRLTSSEKQFALNYAILVGLDDLNKHTPAPADAPAPKRLTEAELSAMEEAALKARQQ